MSAALERGCRAGRTEPVAVPACTLSGVLRPRLACLRSPLVVEHVPPDPGAGLTEVLVRVQVHLFVLQLVLNCREAQSGVSGRGVACGTGFSLSWGRVHVENDVVTHACG